MTRSAEFAMAAFQLFSQRGLDAVTMDDIAASQQATKGSLYWHYKSKDEIIEAACTHYYKVWHKEAQGGIARINDPIGKIRHIIRTSVHSCLIDEHNRIFTMEILARSLHDESTRKGWRGFFDSVRAFYLALVETAVEDGALDLDEVEPAVDAMLSAMEGYKLRAVFEPDLCSRSQEQVIANQLLGLLNIEGAQPDRTS